MAARSTGWRACTVATVWLVGAAIGGCRPGVPVIDTGSKPPNVRGTITGAVRGPEGTAPAAGRTVVAVETQTQMRYEIQTNEAGTYTFAVPPGTYRLELVLLPGESLSKQPGQISLTPSDLESGHDFVLGGPAGAKPR